MHAADDVDNAGFAIFRFEQRVENAQDDGATCRQGKKRPARQALEIVTAIANAPNTGQFPYGQFKAQHDHAGSHAAHDTQQGVGQD